MFLECPGLFGDLNKWLQLPHPPVELHQEHVLTFSSTPSCACIPLPLYSVSMLMTLPPCVLPCAGLAVAIELFLKKVHLE